MREVTVNHDQQCPDLVPVVARLVPIALRVATRSVAALKGTRLPLAFGYRSWPTYHVVGHRKGHEEILKFYACPKGAATQDDESFSLGTRFVMETYRIEEERSPRGSAKLPVRHELVQVFVMQKYASLETSGLPSRAVDGWLFATFAEAGLSAPSRSDRVTGGAGLRGWTALTTQGVPTEGSVCPCVSLSHILQHRYLRTARSS